MYQRKVPGLEPFNLDLDAFDEEKHVIDEHVLIKHPDHEELIPAICEYAHGHVHANFQGAHPHLGAGFAFNTFEKPGLAHVGSRLI